MAETYLAYISFPALNKSFDLDIETIADGFSKSIVRHEYPHADGALLEDMGQKARTSRIRCYFGLLNGAASYDDYFDFIAALDEADQLVFVHPVYGVINGSIEAVDARHDDRVQAPEVDITFVEGRIEDVTTNETAMPGAGEKSFLDGLDEQQAGLADDVTADVGDASLAAKALDPNTGILAQLQNASAKIRSYAAQVDSAVATLEGTLMQVEIAANTVLSTVQFAENLPGRVLGAVAHCIERVAESYNALRSFPAQFQRSMQSGVSQLEASFRTFRSKAPAGSTRAISETAAMTTIADHIRQAGAARMALEAAYGFAADQGNRLAAKKNESQKSFDMQGNYFAPTAPGPIMTQNDIESTLAAVMAQAQSATDLMRGKTQHLKYACSSLVDYARMLMLQSGRIKQVDIAGTMPLHLILLQYKLPYNAAGRVLAINPQIKHPNFVSGTINLYTV